MSEGIPYIPMTRGTPEDADKEASRLAEFGLPMEPCAACGFPSNGSWSIEDEDGDERSLCEHCGGAAMPCVAALRQLIVLRDGFLGGKEPL